MKTVQEIETLITRLCAGVIAHNDKFKLKMTFGGSRMNRYVIQCHPDDGSRIVGTGGLRFKALKLLMQAAGAKIGHGLVLITVERPKGVSEIDLFPPFQYNPRWPKDQITQLLYETCDSVFKYPFKIESNESVGACIFIIDPHKLEQSAFMAALAPALNNIFSGIGTTSGCLLSIDIQ